MREGDLAWVFPFLFCCAGFRFLVLCFITSDLCCLVRLFFDWRVLPRWFGCTILRLQDWNWCFAAACFASRTAQRKVVELIGIWMFLWCFLLVLLDFCFVFEIYLQWIFRKEYAGWRVWNLCVLAGKKDGFVLFSARSFWCFAADARKFRRFWQGVQSFVYRI